MCSAGEKVHVPSFLLKLWTIVDDSAFENVIRWTKSGLSFQIVDEKSFVEQVLPKYFKHSNISSFVRQLHMYGFRKVSSGENDKSSEEKFSIEFQHPLFQKGGSSLLKNIKRKGPLKIGEVRIYYDEVQKMMAEIQSLRAKQGNVNSRLAELEKEYATLWLEMSNLRKKYSEQQNLLTQVLQFIVNLVNGKRTENTNKKRSLQALSGPSTSKCARQYFHFPEEKEEAMEMVNDGYTLVEEEYKHLLDKTLFVLKDESKNLSSSTVQINTNDRKDQDVSSQDVPMTEDSLTLNLNFPVLYFQELLLDKSSGQEAKDDSLDLVSFLENKSILMEDKSDTQCYISEERYTVYSFSNLGDPLPVIRENVYSGIFSQSGRAKEKQDSWLIPHLFIFHLSDEMHLHCIEGNLAEISGKEVNHNSEHVSKNLSLMESKEDDINGTNGAKDKYMIEHKETPLFFLLEEVPLSDCQEKCQDSNDFVLEDLKNPSNVLSDVIPQNTPSQEDTENHVENMIPQLDLESSGGSSALPLFFLSPSTSFFEECVETESSP
ncbi:heat shock factor protein 3-like [Perognathus longimembris pacificus]|uniref:heat shock factor protein 3-like n=1 Tax=Perognathus longimembris pacificus TaxID=214514 RepID=UPI0020193F5C|nr:heat shock factor protein 3-like [Perognathus longimembris pacificus]